MTKFIKIYSTLNVRRAFPLYILQKMIDFLYIAKIYGYIHQRTRRLTA